MTPTATISRHHHWSIGSAYWKFWRERNEAMCRHFYARGAKGAEVNENERPECPHDDRLYEPGEHEYQEIEICADCGERLRAVDTAGEE